MPTAVPIDAVKLLEAAEEWLGSGGVPGRPRAVLLRRAISNAYYALFHHVNQTAAAHLLPNGTRQEQLALTRSFNHQSTKEICEWVAGRRGNPPRHCKDMIRTLQSSSIVGVADAFCDLQEARHRADYDHLAPFSKATALLHLADAQRAIQLLGSAPDEERDAFLSLIALRANLK
jgi:hypothetical protein